MAERITMNRLRNLVRILNNETKNKKGHYDYSLESNAGGVRLVRANESVDVSPRLSKADLYQWIHAYRQGIDIGRSLELGL